MCSQNKQLQGTNLSVSAPSMSAAQHPQPYMAASPILPSVFMAIPPDETPAAALPAMPNKPLKSEAATETAQLEAHVHAGLRAYMPQSHEYIVHWKYSAILHCTLMNRLA